MESANLTASSLGILDIHDSKHDFSADMEDPNFIPDFTKTLQVMKKNQQQTMLSRNQSLNLEISNIVNRPSQTREELTVNDSGFIFLRPLEKTNRQQLTSSTPKSKKPFNIQKVQLRSLSEDLCGQVKNADLGWTPLKNVEDDNIFGDVPQPIALSDVESVMFVSGDCAVNLLDADEKQFSEDHRFQIGKLSSVSTIVSNFSYAANDYIPNDEFFKGRSEKLGSLRTMSDSQRPSFGLIIKSPQKIPFDHMDISTKCSIRTESIQSDDSKKPPNSNSLKTTLAMGNDGVASNVHPCEQKPTMPPRTGPAFNQNTYQPLSIQAPIQSMPSYSYPGLSSFHSAPYSWSDPGMGSYHPQLCRQNLCSIQFPSVTAAYNYPVTVAQSKHSMLVMPPELPEQIICLNDNLEVSVPITNPSSESAFCTLKVLHTSILHTDAIKLDLMANSNFNFPELMEIKACSRYFAKVTCSFNVPGKYRIYLEVTTNSQQFTPANTALTVEVEDAKVEMSSKLDGSSLLDFGPICRSNTVTPQFIRIVNNARASVPVTVSINAISHSALCDNFIFPPEQLSHIINSSSHVWMDVLPTFVVVRLQANSSLELPVTIDIANPHHSGEEHVVASVQLLLKGNRFFRTKRLMKLSAHVRNPQMIPKSTTPKAKQLAFSKMDNANDNDDCDNVENKFSFYGEAGLTLKKRDLYFPGVEVGKLVEKPLVLMNSSKSVKLVVQISITSLGDECSFFIKDHKNGLCKQQKIVFKPKETNAAVIVFRPHLASTFVSSLQVKVSSLSQHIQKQDFLIPLYGYGGSSEVVMENPVPDSSRHGYLHITPLNKSVHEFNICLNNLGSRPAFVAIIPMKEGQIELDSKVKLESKAFIIKSKAKKEVTVVVKLSRFDEMLSFSQSFTIFCGDEQFRQLLKSKVNVCKDRKICTYTGFGLLKVLDIMQPFEGETMIPQEKLYKDVKRDVSDVFYESIKMYDVMLSTDECFSGNRESFFAISNLQCSYGSLMNSTMSHFGSSPPSHDTKKGMV